MNHKLMVPQSFFVDFLDQKKYILMHGRNEGSPKSLDPPTFLFLLGTLLKECGYDGELGRLGRQTVRFVHLWRANAPASLCPDKETRSLSPRTNYMPLEHSKE